MPDPGRTLDSFSSGGGGGVSLSDFWSQLEASIQTSPPAPQEWEYIKDENASSAVSWFTAPCPEPPSSGPPEAQDWDHIKEDSGSSEVSWFASSPCPSLPFSGPPEAQEWEQVKEEDANPEVSRFHNSPCASLSGFSVGSSVFDSDSDAGDLNSSPTHVRREGLQTIRMTEKSTITRPEWIRTSDSSPSSPSSGSSRNIGSSGSSSEPSTPKKTENELNLELLASLERSPRHKWTSTQRTLLCVLWRWYDRDTAVFGHVFNRIFKTELSDRKVSGQFENNLRLYGQNAYAEYKKVYSVDFADPWHIFTNIRNKIEKAASGLGLHLRRLKSEVTEASGSAVKAKAERTRERYKSLVRNLQQASVSHASQVHVFKNKEYLGGMAIADTPENEEEFVDVEDSDITPPSSLPSSPRAPWRRRSLGFRVFEMNSKQTPFKDGEFVSTMGSVWNRAAQPIPEPPTEELFMYMVNGHLSLRGGDSHFVSVSGSLLWSLREALRKTSSVGKPAHIAIIDLEHEGLNKNHIFDAAALASHLRWKKGQLRWTKYKAATETLFWGSLPKCAILNVIDSSLIDQFDTLLSLKTPGDTELSTPRTAKLLITQKHQLDAAKAEDWARLAQVFFGDGDIRPSHVGEFVQCLVDGWAYSTPSSLETVSRHFAFAFDHPKLSNRAVAAAFQEGIAQGLRNVKRFSGKKGKKGKK